MIKKMIINAIKGGGGTSPALYLQISTSFDIGTGKQRFHMADSAMPARMFKFGTCVPIVGGFDYKDGGIATE